MTLETNCFITGKNYEITKKFPDNSVDCVITSPPYDNLRSYDTGSGDTWSFEEFNKIAEELYRIVKVGGVVVWVVGDAVVNNSETGSSFEQALHFKKIGFLLHDTMIYEKNGPSFPARRSGNRYSQVFEYMFVFSKKTKPKVARLICDKPNRWAGYTSFGKSKIRKKDGTLEEREMKPVPEYSPRFNIWRYNTGKNYSTKDKEAFEHPAIFPEELAEDHILSWTNENDIVLDPFSGSGTTCKMAYMNKRRFIGIDISQKYNDIAYTRVKNSSIIDGENKKLEF